MTNNKQKLLRVMQNILNNIKKALLSLVKKVNFKNIKFGNFSFTLSENGRGTIFFVFFLLLFSFIFLGIGFLTTTLFFFFILTLYFFRDPDRVLPNKKNVVVSPCDGLIINIATSMLPKELSIDDQKEYTKISVFMNITDVHVQRIPVDCNVKQIEYIKGKFINASFDKSSEDNERNLLLLERENGDRICVVQIAGFIARRIVCNVEKDEICKIGEKYGMIKFGSRIEIYIPKNYKINVLKGQRVVCGETILCEF